MRTDDRGGLRVRRLSVRLQISFPCLDRLYIITYENTVWTKFLAELKIADIETFKRRFL
jgi:hypothetical protein